jgi:hypothetical protein
MKKLLFVAMIGFATMLTACSDGPQARVEAFYKHLDRAEIADAMAIVDPGQVKALGDINFRTLLSKFSEGTKTSGGIKSISSSGSERGDLADYDVAITSVKGKQEPEHIVTKMIKIEGKWYVDFNRTFFAK